jgi:SlyX protein
MYLQMINQEHELAKQLAEAESAIAELETKLAFQEDTIEQLNVALSDQQHQMNKIQFQLTHVIDKVKSIQPSDIAKVSEETPPPHY